MPKLVRTKHATYYPQDELDDYNLIEEEEEEDEYEDDDDTNTRDELDDEGDEHEVEDEDEPEEDEHQIAASDEDEDEDEPRRKPSRAQDRIRKLAKERKAAKEEIETLRRQLAGQNQNQQQRQQQVNPAEEAAFRASLAPEDLIRYDVNKILQTTKQQSDLQIFNMQDQMDRQTFQLKAATSPTHRRYGNEVERRLLELRTNHRMNVSREVILANIVGEAVLSGKHKTVSRDKAKENLKKNSTKSSSNRSDATREASRGGTDREKRRKRLEGVSF